MTDTPERRAGAAAEGRPAASRTDATDATPGKPTDALSALASALTSAKPTPDKADPTVALAFALGWQVSELASPPGVPARDQRSTSDARSELDDLDELGQEDRIRILVTQVTAALARLRDPFGKAGFTRIDALAGLDDQCAAGGSARGNAVKQLHEELLSKLTATDFRLGKAYRLGVALARLCRTPRNAHEIRRALGSQDVIGAMRWLDDLSTALPPHAGHSVAASIATWGAWAGCAWARETPVPAGQKRGDAAGIDDVLQRWNRQGELWRALLSGEKQAGEMLEIEDWLSAARDFERRIREAAWQVVRHMPVLVVLVVVLFGAGVALMIDQQSRGWIVAGAASVLSALGLTWKGIGGSIGKLAAKLEQPLFGAATDVAVAEAITLLYTPRDPTRDTGQARRARLASSLGRQAPQGATEDSA